MESEMKGKDRPAVVGMWTRPLGPGEVPIPHPPDVFVAKAIYQDSNKDKEKL
jgi:hypothetical protein